MHRRGCVGAILERVAALGGAHLLPLLAQRLALLFGQLAKLLILIADALLLLRRQAFELLPALAQLLTLIGRHRAPLRETVLRTCPLLD